MKKLFRGVVDESSAHAAIRCMFNYVIDYVCFGEHTVIAEPKITQPDSNSVARHEKYKYIIWDSAKHKLHHDIAEDLQSIKIEDPVGVEVDQTGMESKPKARNPQIPALLNLPP